MIKRTYSKILEILNDEKMPSSILMKRFEERFGYAPKKQTIYSDLSRARKEGIIKKDENGFYYIDNDESEE